MPALTPTIIVFLAFGTAYALLFHLWRGRRLAHLLLFWLVSILGFGLGYLVASLWTRRVGGKPSLPTPSLTPHPPEPRTVPATSPSRGEVKKRRAEGYLTTRFGMTAKPRPLTRVLLGRGNLWRVPPATPSLFRLRRREASKCKGP